MAGKPSRTPMTAMLDEVLDLIPDGLLGYARQSELLALYDACERAIAHGVQPSHIRLVAQTIRLRNRSELVK